MSRKSSGGICGVWRGRRTAGLAGETRDYVHARRQWLLLIVAIVVLVSDSSAQEKQPSFAIVISGPQTAKIGAPVGLSVSVKNTSSGRIDFLRTTVYFDFGYDVTDSQGNEPAETEIYREVLGKVPHVTRFPMSRADTWVSPGKSLEFYVYLTDLFDLKEGKYTIRVKRPEGMWQFDSDPLPKPSGLVVTSNTINLTVTP